MEDMFGIIVGSVSIIIIFVYIALSLAKKFLR
jgi:hypothetical protein